MLVLTKYDIWEYLISLFRTSFVCSAFERNQLLQPFRLSKAEIGARPRHVRFTPESGHS
jgi:hypothetical protein